MSAHLGHEVFLELEETWENLDCKVIKVLRATLACPVFRDRKVTQVSRELDSLAPLALKVFLGFLVLLESLGHQESRDRMVSLEDLVHLGRRGNQDGAFQGLKAPWGLRVSPVSQERRETWGYQVSREERE